jgi:putative signal transducing protein
MNPNDLVTVYTVSNGFEANILRNALTDMEIECFLQGENQAAESGLMALPIQLQVPAAQAEAAREFFAEHERRLANRKETDDDDDTVEESIAPLDA